MLDIETLAKALGQIGASTASVRRHVEAWTYYGKHLSAGGRRSRLRNQTFKEKGEMMRDMNVIEDL